MSRLIFGSVGWFWFIKIFNRPGQFGIFFLYLKGIEPAYIYPINYIVNERQKKKKKLKSLKKKKSKPKPQCSILDTMKQPSLFVTNQFKNTIFIETKVRKPLTHLKHHYYHHYQRLRLSLAHSPWPFILFQSPCIQL